MPLLTPTWLDVPSEEEMGQVNELMKLTAGDCQFLRSPGAAHQDRVHSGYECGDDDDPTREDSGHMSVEEIRARMASFTMLPMPNVWGSENVFVAAASSEGRLC